MDKKTDTSIIGNVIRLVLSSNRLMPAHYTSNGDRTQSFCIDFDIDRDAEYNMASYSFYKGGEAAANMTAHEASSIIKRGEDITVGSYILQKLGGDSEASTLIEQLAGTEYEKMYEYFSACSAYGLSLATKH